MTPNETRLPAAIETALTTIQTTLSSVAGRVSDALGTSAQSTTRISERDLLNSSQFELRRNMGTFQIVFKDDLRDKVRQEIAPRAEAKRPLGTADWQSLSLVDDHEVEERLFADRIGQMISHECEAELRDLSGYVGALLQTGRADVERNPLRAEVLGGALYRAIEAISEEPETRKLLARDIGQAMARAMPACYQQIVADMQARGVQPLVFTVRGVEGPGNMLPGLNSGYAGLASTRGDGGELDTHAHTYPDSPHEPATGRSRWSGAGGTSHGTSHGTAGGSSTLGGSRFGGTRGGSGSSRHGGHPSPADAQLMTLLRRLTAIASRPGEFDAIERHSDGRSTAHSSGHSSGHASGGDSGSRRAASELGHQPAWSGPQYIDGNTGHGGLMAVNLIRAHRDELMQASSGQLDHMVIDVVGSLFDQILSDSRVPPQMARQIARLQLPVLRVALHDRSFFSSRRHPVRRFVNRIASLACAFDDFDDGPGKELLARVKSLVQEIVEGDFDQIDLYAAKLAELETFIDAQARGGAVQKSDAVATLEGKESELRVQQRYMQQLQAALGPLSLPAYLRDFVTQVWSQALVLAVRRDGPTSDRAQRYRRVGRELVMSVQPKGSPILRKKFLMQLPPLMKDLKEGMQVIAWPEPAQREFFAHLLPAHADSLKSPPMSELDYNLMAKQLEAIFNAPVPGTQIAASEPMPEVEEAVVAQRFSPEEAERVGFVPEAAVDWSKPVVAEANPAPGTRAEAGAEAVDTAPIDLGVDIDLDVGAADPAEPTRGPQLIEHIKVGFAYRMLLKDAWQKVRLAHVSAGRGFFVFTHGRKHQETISMTARMLTRMCETGRMTAVESAYLMERATQRARKQLAALKAPTRH